MGTPFMAEIRLMSCNFAPRGWAQCNGQLLPINQNQALFSLLGTMYGGNGQTTFGLPNFQGRIPVHMSGGFQVGQAGGEYNHTLNQQELPQHTHLVGASSAATGGTSLTTGNFLGGGNNVYAPPSNLVTIAPETIPNVGGSQPHNNTAPSLTLTFCIALTGVFPSRN